MDEGSGEAGELAMVVAISVGCLAYMNSQQNNNPNNSGMLQTVTVITAAKAVSKVELMAKIVAMVVLPGITVLHQTFKMVAGTAVHLIKVANVKPLVLIPS